MKTLVRRFALITLVCAAALAQDPAQDIAGKWSGKLEFVSPEGEKRTVTTVVIIKNDQGRYSATGGPSEAQQQPFVNVSFQDGVFRFDMGDRLPMRVELRLKEDQLTGQGSVKSPDKVVMVDWSLNRQR